MSKSDFQEWRPHPWHGLEAGREPPLHVDGAGPQISVPQVDGVEHAARVVEAAQEGYKGLLAVINR